MNVILAEDERALSEVIERNLKAHGHAVFATETGEGAIMRMVEEWPDVLILDVNLPDLSAWEILRRLGEASRQQLRVIVMSAYPISRKRIEEFRPHAALQKPFPIAALLHAMEGVSETARTDV